MDQHIKEKEQLEQEIDTLSRQISKNPQDVERILRRAELRRLLADYTQKESYLLQALEDNEMAVSLAPQNGITYLGRGITNYALNQQDNAIADFTTSLDLVSSTSDKARVYYNRGVARWQKLKNLQSADLMDQREFMRNARNALGDYRSALLLDPSMSIAANNAGAISLTIGNYSGAIQYLTTGLRLNPNETSALFNRAICYENLVPPRYSNKVNVKKAIDDYSRLLELDSEYLAAYLNRAVCFEWLGDASRYSDREGLRKAKQDYDEVLAREPNIYVTQALINRGWVLEHLGELNDAIRDFRRFTVESSDGFAVGQVEAHLEHLESRMN